MANDSLDAAPPGRLPEPPDDLAERDLPLREVVAQVWFRGHKVKHGPLHFNRVEGRFGPPAGEFGTLYLGEDEFCSFIEAFNQQVQDRGPLGLFVSEPRLDAYCLCPVTTTRKTQLVDLTNGPALRLISPDADNRINDGLHSVSQRWALAFWEHPSRPDGLYYRLRRAPERSSIALFDRVADHLVAPCEQNLLRDPVRLGAILDYFGCALVP
jgi:hypothetical protein